MVGRYVFDAFPDASGRGEQSALATSMRRALATGRADRLPLLNYAVATDTSPEAVEERWWSVVNLPLLDAGGTAVALLNAVEDVTQVIVEQQRSQLAQAAADDLLRQSRLMSQDL